MVGAEAWDVVLTKSMKQINDWISCVLSRRCAIMITRNRMDGYHGTVVESFRKKCAEVGHNIY
jgi:hypothetical protein